MNARTTPTPLGSAAALVSYNIPHTSMAIVDASSTITVWRRDGASRSWAAETSWSPGGCSVTCIAWAPPEFGNVLVAGTAEGDVCVWAQGPDGQWTQRAHIAASARSATAAAFAPRQVGPLVAIAFDDGAVRTYEAAAPLDAPSWDPHAELQLDREAGAATALAWREADPGLPPLLVVGTAAGGAQIWSFREALLRWERAAVLPGEAPTAAVAWAPRLGRPHELVAVAAGPCVTLWSLAGPTDALEAEQVAVLNHEAGVWQVGWNMTGSWLAASTEGGEVALWRPDLAGEWTQVHKIVGGEDQAMINA